MALFVTLHADTGSSNSDDITNNGQVDVFVTSDVASWQYSTDGGAHWTAGTGTSFTLAQGTYAPNELEIQATDIAGNTSTIVNWTTITIDTTAPAAPTLSNLVGQPVGGGSIEVVGIGEIGSTINLYEGTTLVGTGTVDASGNFDIKTTATFAGGVHFLTATDTDVAGNTSTVSAGFPVAVDGVSGQIDSIYAAVLQRAPTSAEVGAGLSTNTNLGLSALIASVVDSPEAQLNVYPIVQIIDLATATLPTASQLNGWAHFVESAGLLQGNLQTNVLLQQMALAFVGSDQFANTYNGGHAVNPNAPITATILSQIIQAATGVAATQTQINKWLSAHQTIDQVFVNFALGDQYSAHIQSMVQTYLTGLAETAAGVIGWTNSTNDGLTSTKVEQAYQSVLQCAPSTAEVNTALSIDFTTGNLASIAGIVSSLEAQNNIYPIAQIVELATGSLPTASQLSGWVPFVESAGLLQGNLQTNALLDQMALAFVGSTQFGNTYNGGHEVDPNAPITATIAGAIIHAATGAVTQAQIDAWVSTKMTVDQVFVAFALGDQYSAYIQDTVQAYLTATGINAAGLSTVNGVDATGSLTLGTAATPLTADHLTVLGGSGSLSVVATGNGDTITELSSSTTSATITANGSGDTINLANGTNVVTANGANDQINLGVISTGSSINAAQTIHASGAGDVITFALTDTNSNPITWGAASTVDGGNSATGIGANSTVNFGSNVGAGSQTVVLTSDLTHGTTSGGTSTAGIDMTTLGHVVHAAGDQIVFSNAASESLAGSAVDVTAAASLANALDLAAAAAGNIAAHTGVVEWFHYTDGNTYVVEAINSTSAPALHAAITPTDEVVKILGVVDLANATLAGHTLTL